MFRMVEHQADIAVILQASDRTGLFKSALEAIISLLTGLEQDQFPNEKDCMDNPETFKISSIGEDDEERLVDLMNEMLYFCQVEGWFPLTVETLSFQIDNKVSAILRGLRNPSELTFQREIKAATYHDLKILTSPAWYAKVVFDV